MSERPWSRGRIALAEGQHQDAVTDLRPAAETHVCTICVLPDLARAHEASGNPDSAVQAYERYRATPWKFRFEPDAVELGWSMRRLGELYEQRGEPAKAGTRRPGCCGSGAGPTGSFGRCCRS